MLIVAFGWMRPVELHTHCVERRGFDQRAIETERTQLPARSPECHMNRLLQFMEPFPGRRRWPALKALISNLS